MIHCERCWTVLQKTQCKTLINVLWFGECLRLRQWKHLYSSERITQTICIPSKHSGKAHFKADNQDIWTIDIGTIRWDIWSVSNQLGKFPMETMKKSSVSRMQRFMSSQTLCYALERWVRTQHQILLGKKSWCGSKIHHNTEHWTQSTENRWNSSGIFSKDSQHWSLSAKSKSSWAKLTNPNNSKDEFSSCRCSMTSYGEIKTMRRNVLLIPHLCLYLQNHFQQDVGHSSDLDHKQSGILLTTRDHKENGTESLNWWWTNSEKADTQFSEPRVRCPEERSKAKEVENYRYTSVPMVMRLKLFFAQSFLSISSVSTEHLLNKHRETCCDRAIRPFFRASRLIAQEDLLQKHKERVQNLWQPN